MGIDGLPGPPGRDGGFEFEGHEQARSRVEGEIYTCVRKYVLSSSVVL